MANLLQQASVWLDGKRKAHLSGPVTYVRGTGSVAVQATVGRTVFEINSDIGVLERVESRDFLISAADLVLAGRVTLPQPGDAIHQTVGYTVLVFEVAAPGGEPCWRYSDSWNRTLRIHTKYLGPVEA